jgi:hypothetical protein
MKIKTGRIYRHFKGDYYIVIDTALNNEDERVYVIYRALYGDGQLFVRPLEDFTARVDRTKHPNATQEYKFELQDINSINPTHK